MPGFSFAHRWTHGRWQDQPVGASARIEAVCTRHGVRLIEAALQFPLQHPSVVSVIPGGQRPAEVESNRALLDAKLPAALWADLKQEGLMHADAPTG